LHWLTENVHFERVLTREPHSVLFRLDWTQIQNLAEIMASALLVALVIYFIFRFYFPDPLEVRELLVSSSLKAILTFPFIIIRETVLQ